MEKNKREITLKIKKLIENFEKGKHRKFTFLLIGRTGVGKSSTINSLLGQTVAPVGDYEPETAGVKKFNTEIEGIQFVVIDTPGLCDDLAEAGNDATYIQQICCQASQIDCMWFVSELDATRVTGDEKRAIKLITESFGTDVWKHAIFVLTFADKVDSSVYKDRLSKRTELICQEIKQHTSLDVNFSIPSVAVSNINDKAPDGEWWLGELYITVFTKISKEAAIPYLIGTASRIVSSAKPDEANEPYMSNNIVLSPKNVTKFKQEINIKILGGVAGAGTGAIIGVALAGPVGAVVGGGIGAVLGLIADLFFGSR